MTSKTKKQSFGPFFDVSLAAYSEAGASCPPSLICPELQPKMQLASGEPSEGLIDALGQMFDVLSADGRTLSKEEEVCSTQCSPFSFLSPNGVPSLLRASSSHVLIALTDKVAYFDQ